METKDFKFKITEVNDEEGTFTGIASVFGEVDSYNEIVEKGAFRKTLKENDGKFALCWFHDITEPLGIVHAKEKNQGLEVRGELNLDVQSAREKRSLMKQGAIKGLSIGFKTIKDAWDDKIRKLKEIKLYEISPITLNFQACPGAEIGEVKNDLEPKSMPDILERVLSIEVAENLSPESTKLIKETITRLSTLLEDWEPLEIGTLGPIYEPSLEGFLDELKKLNKSLGGKT